MEFTKQGVRNLNNIKSKKPKPRREFIPNSFICDHPSNKQENKSFGTFCKKCNEYISSSSFEDSDE